MTSSRSRKPRTQKKTATTVAKSIIDSGIDLVSGTTEKAVEALEVYEVLTTFLKLATRYEGKHDGDPHAPNLQPAPDPIGVITVGYGSALRHPDEPRFLFWYNPADRRIADQMYPDGITDDEAMILLIAEARSRLASLRQRPAYCALPAYAQGALLDFSYNLSPSHLYSSTLWELIEAGQTDYSVTSPEVLWDLTKKKVKPLELDEAFTAYSRVTDATGMRMTLPGLFARRLAELFTFEDVPVEEAIERADEIVANLDR